jgi:hypothetical protein
VTAETEAERQQREADFQQREADFQQREADFQQRMQRDDDLCLRLCEHLWGLYGDTLRLADEEFEVVSGEDVPGYEDDNFAVLLRRISDGKVFEAEIDVAINPPARANRPRR